MWSTTRALVGAVSRRAVQRLVTPSVSVASGKIIFGESLVLKQSYTPGTRHFSDDSHSDFAPQRKTVADDGEEVLKMISQHVKENRIMLYMKGTPSMPMCGFSAKVVQVLQNEGVDFSSVNVLDYPAVREGIKKFSEWPTIPQLYVDGEFLGGCDIITGMHESGELKDILKGEH